MLCTASLAVQADQGQSAGTRRLEEPIATLQELNKVIEARAFAEYQRADIPPIGVNQPLSFEDLYLQGAIYLRFSHLRYDLLHPGGVHRINGTTPNADEFKDVLDKHDIDKAERHGARKTEENVRSGDWQAERLLNGPPPIKERLLNIAPAIKNR